MTSDIVRDAIAEELEEIARAFPTPVAPFGYGTDISCAGDVTPTMESVDPFSTRAIGEAIARRLDTPRGGLVDDPNYGLDIKAYCNRGVTDAEVRGLAEAMRAEVVRDDRVARARVTVIPSPTGSSLTARILVTPRDPRAGTFSLTLAVTSAEVLIQELRAA